QRRPSTTVDMGRLTVLLMAGAATSLPHLLPSLPARLVDGGVCLPVLVLVAFKAERIEHVLRLFDVLNGQDAAGMTPTLRILPRRYEGGGGFGNRVADVMLVTVVVELAPRVVQPFDQVTHGLPPGRAAGRHSCAPPHRSPTRPLHTFGTSVGAATPPPAARRGLWLRPARR